MCIYTYIYINSKINQNRMISKTKQTDTNIRRMSYMYNMDAASLGAGTTTSLRPDQTKL